MLYFLGWSTFLLFFKSYFGFRTVGRKNVPRKGAFIFASNHVSYLDPMILGTSIHRSLYYMAREDLFSHPCGGWIMRQIHAFPVRRGDSDFGAMKEAMRIIASGKPLVIFPEGTRAKDGNLGPAKPGIGFIAAKARVPIVPAYIHGSFDALSRGLNTLERRPVSIFIGEPIDYRDWCDGKKDRSAYQAISDEVMRRIAALKDRHASRPS